MRTNVLKKITIGNPLAKFNLQEEYQEYKQIKTPEQLAEFYHKMLTKFEGNSEIYHWITLMISFSCQVNINRKIPTTL